MNEEQYKKWKQDAMMALLNVYSADDANTIIDWFNNIRGSHERDLLGDNLFEMVYKISDVYPAVSGFNLYGNMMARLWIYAPFIVKQFPDGYK